MSKHTPGPWKSGGVITAADGQHIAQLMATNADEQIFANARLIAAAPCGLKIAEAAYLFVLGLPHDGRRIKNQGLYAGLRDYIAKATGRTSQEVQESFEEKAAK